MSDDLRTRIAAAISGYIDRHMQEDFTYGDAADAVIRELGLREERDRPYSTRTGWTGDWRHRYVTEWEFE